MRETSDDPPAAITRPRLGRWPLVLGSWATAFLFAVGIGLALQGRGDWNVGLPWEHTILRWFDEPLPLWLDAIMLTVPWVGTNISLLPLSLAAAAWLRWRAQRGDLALHLVVMQIGVLTLNQVTKAVFDRARPDLWELRGQYGQAAYPSGHAIASIAVLFTYATLVHRERGWRWPYAIAALILVVSLWSRLYLGVHWPSDVIAGAVMGAIWLAGTLAAFPPRAVDRVADRH